MKRTHKFKALGDIQAVVAKASSLSAAAKALGVNRSTLHRWLGDGKVKRPRSQPAHRTGDVVALPVEPSKDWAAQVRADYVLSATDSELVTLAAQALRLATTADTDRGRLDATARFAALVRQLNLDAQERAEIGVPAAVQRPRRVARVTPGDPRAALMAVK